MRKKTCKICKLKYEPNRPLQQVCSPLCAIKYNQRQKEKAWKKEKKERKEKLKTHQDYVRELQVVFNKFIRTRDQGKNCISCGKKWQSNFQAGHYFSVGGNPELRFCEDNVHGQCRTCNLYLHGNLINYRQGLVERFTALDVAELELLRGHPFKASIEELKGLKELYKLKTKQLERNTK